MLQFRHSGVHKCASALKLEHHITGDNIKTKNKVRIIWIVIISLLILVPYFHFYTYSHKPIIVKTDCSWNEQNKEIYLKPNPSHAFWALEKNITLNTSIGQFHLAAFSLGFPGDSSWYDNYTAGYPFDNIESIINLAILNISNDQSSPIGFGNLQLCSTNPNLTIKQALFCTGCSAFLSFGVFTNVSKGYNGYFNTSAQYNQFFSNFKLSFNIEKVIWPGFFYLTENEGRYTITL